MPATSSCSTVRSGVRRRYPASGCPAAPDARSYRPPVSTRACSGSSAPRSHTRDRDSRSTANVRRCPSTGRRPRRQLGRFALVNRQKGAKLYAPC
jgi:hypothetical protein